MADIEQAALIKPDFISTRAAVRSERAETPLDLNGISVPKVRHWAVLRRSEARCNLALPIRPIYDTLVPQSGTSLFDQGWVPSNKGGCRQAREAR
jgi:hypothetical protein